MNELALFSGAGGGILAGHLLGWRTVAAVEVEDYPRRVLLQRQADGILPRFPIWDDVTTFDGRAWKGKIDVISGGFPCQDISSAGNKAGIEGERSGLWGEMARIVGEVRPRFVYVENSPMLTFRGLDRVLGDLTKMGYDCRWGIMGAHHVGAPHKRDRIWIVANATKPNDWCCNSKSIEGQEPESRKSGCTRDVANTKFFGQSAKSNTEIYAAPTINRKADQPRSSGKISGTKPSDTASQRPQNGPIGAIQKPPVEKPQRPGWWTTEPQLGRVANGVANRVDRLKAIGNGQVAAVAALAWKILKD